MSEENVEDLVMWLANEWRDKKCVWWCAFGTKAEALEAAGLQE